VVSQFLCYQAHSKAFILALAEILKISRSLADTPMFLFHINVIEFVAVLGGTSKGFIQTTHQSELPPLKGFKKIDSSVVLDPIDSSFLSAMHKW